MNKPRRVAYTPPRGGRSGKGLITGILSGAAALAVLAAVWISQAPLSIQGLLKSNAEPVLAKAPPGSYLMPFPDDLKADESNIGVNCSYTYRQNIIPSTYRSMESIVSMHCSTNYGAAKLMVSVEIPEFTQKYEQMVDVTRSETDLRIHPPQLESAYDSLDTSREAQLVVTVKDMGSGRVIRQDTNPVKLYSRYDMLWKGDDGTPYYENILAWVTPEAPEIDRMLRLTADSCGELFDGGLNSVIGYQEYGSWSHEEITYVQVCAMMHTLAKKCNVKYIMTSFSSTSSELQSIKTPAEVINNAAGICIETAVTMASAVERTDMHAMIIMSPGHSQVAVETWRDSGEYFLVETTALEAAAAGKFNNNVIFHYSKDEWAKYLAQDGYVAIDCDFVE